MSEYRNQAKRLRALRQTPTQEQSHCLQLSSSGWVQAECHRPPSNVNALVQRHYFPAEGAVFEGIGEPANADVGAGTAEVADWLAKYQLLCRRRASETSKAIKVEQDANIKLALSARERLQLAREFGLRVASENRKVSTRRPGQTKETLSKGLSPAGQPYEPCLDRVLESQGGAINQTITPPCSIEEPFTTSSQEANRLLASTTTETAEPILVKEPKPFTAGASNADVRNLHAVEAMRTTSASMAARQRLAAHSSAYTAADMTRLAKPVLPRDLNSVSSTSFRVLKTRLLKPSSLCASGSKSYKGKLLPASISVNDEPGLLRVAQKVAGMDMNLELPRLCACPNTASIFDPKYVTHCARNCPLYLQPDCYASLLTAWLRQKDII